VTRYADTHPRLAGTRWPHPWVAEVFHPDRGWTRQAMAKRISPSWARSLRRDGAQAVRLAFGPHPRTRRRIRIGPGGPAAPVTADFTLRELTSRAAPDTPRSAP
jgi:hypothetical protein